MKNAALCVVTICLALTTVGCDEALSSLTGPTPNLEPTFSSIQREIFQSGDSSGRSACTSCHVPGGRGVRIGSLDLSSAAIAYSSLVNVPARRNPAVLLVVPGDPENSYLIHKLEGRLGPGDRSRMPEDGPPFLTEGQIRVIKRWIEIGAPNN